MSADHGKTSPWRGPRGARGWKDLAGSWGRGGQPPCRNPRPPRRSAALMTAQPASSWSPADGDADLVGQPGQDVLALRGVTLTQLVIAINVLEPGLSLHLDGDGGLGFVDQSGESRPFSGDLTIQGATLRFTGVASIILV